MRRERENGGEWEREIERQGERQSGCEGRDKVWVRGGGRENVGEGGEKAWVSQSILISRYLT